MTGTMWGLDPQQCRELVKLLKDSAKRLDHASSQLNQAVSRTSWQGPDSGRFRAQWPGQRSQLLRTANALEDVATVVLRNIAEQERASSVDGGSPLDRLIGDAKNLWDDFTGGVGDVIGGVKDAVGKGADQVKDGLDWLVGTIGHSAGNLFNASGNVFSQLGHLGMTGLQSLIGNPPSISGFVSQLALTLGSGANLAVVLGTGGMINPHWFDDGTPYAGNPIPVENDSARPVQLPTSASSIFSGVEDAYQMGHLPGTEDGDIRILKVAQADGTYAYIVNIPGTETWGVDGSGQARDLTSNLRLMAGQSTSASQDVILAMQKAGIPADAPVMLTGHSQGGMIAAQLASDPSFNSHFNVTNVMTVGSPIDINSIDPSINVLAAQHQHDIVPRLDLGGTNTWGGQPEHPSNVSVVTMDDPYRAPTGKIDSLIPDFAKNHETGPYIHDLADTGKYPAVGAYEQDPSMRVFLSDDPSKVSAVDIPVGRR